MPCTIKNELDRIMRRFLWAGCDATKKIYFVDWNSICNFKDFGGLGIINLELKNRALLNKWLWRFGNEKESFWRKVICKKNKIEESSIIPARGNSVKSSTLWKFISQPLIQDGPLSRLTRHGFGVIIGNGRNVDFWKDAWVDGFALKDLFPRIFTLVVKKNGKAFDFGSRSNDHWEWKIELRRPLFDWERQQWLDLLNTLKEFNIVKSLEDKFVWKHTPSGEYSPSSFCRQFLSLSYMEMARWKFVWAGLALPKVECFIW